MKALEPTCCRHTGPGLVFVCSSTNPDGAPMYERLRYAIYTARYIAGWEHEIYVLNVGLSDAQADALREENIRVVGVLHDNAGDPTQRTFVLRQKFMFKIFADLFVPGADPVIVADADLEFRGTDSLSHLLHLARDQGKFFIVEEKFRWISNLNVRLEMQNAGPEKAAYVLDEALMILQQHPILNAGLFGGPRPLFCRMMSHCRWRSAALLDIIHWFWEQAALSICCRLPEFADDVEILPTEWNWITHWGLNPDAKVLHFSGEALAQHRTKLPDASYLAAKEPGQTAGQTVRGALALKT